VTARILSLVLANLLMLGLGAGLLPLLRLARTRRELVAKLPLAYAVGLAATGILAAHLALVGVPVGGIVLPLLTALSLAYGLRIEPGERPRRTRRLSELPSLTVLGVAAVFILGVARLFAVRPLFEWDGWAVWGMRARALYDFGGLGEPVFTSPLYPSLQHPLLLPSLEAIGFRFMRGFDGTLAHLQLAGLAIGFVGGAWILFRNRSSHVLLASTLLAILTAPTFVFQLQTNFADVPLAMFVALGVASLAAWLRDGDAGLLAAAALFLGAGALTKNEGEVFALTAFLAVAVAARRAQLKPLLYAALATVAIDLPWRLWVQLQHIRITETVHHGNAFVVSNLFNPPYLSRHVDRVAPAADALFFQIRRLDSWSYLVILVVVGFAATLLLRRIRLALFGAGWLLLSFGALVAFYWITPDPAFLRDSADRTIISLVLGGALLQPVLLGRREHTDAQVAVE
jgi:4-amino-4-deoxy-L-arabinose transferase-like glycosyltransferase